MMTKMILCANPRAQYLAHKDEIDAALQRALDSGAYILSQEVAAFEKEFAHYLGTAYAVGVGSGTEALHIALTACGVQQGDEVITVSHTAVATVAAIALCGAKPIFVDINPLSFTLDPSKLEEAITEHTKAIIPVHIYGHPSDLEPILAIARRRGILVLEDCAQAHGAKYKDRMVGSWGDIACFSFYPTKNLGAIGDGGMIVTSDPELASRVRYLREYGWAERYVSRTLGWNSRLDVIQAAILRVKLKYLDSDNCRRNVLAEIYAQELSDLPWLVLPSKRLETTHVYHLYVIRCKERDKLRAHLEDCGVGVLIHYPVPVHQQPAYSNAWQSPDRLSETERAATEVLSLPMYPELSEADVQTVVQAVRSFDSR
jgi:dTDP-4-amino-4,6-dideoxygalactose transaminase